MGKQVHKKKPQKRTNPLGTSTLQNGAVEIVPKEEEILPIIQKLSSADGGERAWATAGVSNLVIANAPTRKLLLSKGVVPVLIERLTDPQYPVVQEALGALRNLTAVDDEIAIELFARDILTPISSLIPKTSAVIAKVLNGTPVADEEDQEMRKGVWDFAENLISILWSLSETSESHLKSINRLNDIVTFLTSFMAAADKCPRKVVIAAGQCLNTLTDDNKDIFIEFQNHPEYIDMLVSIVKNVTDEEYMLVRILACATLLNVREAVQSSGSWDEENDPIAELNKSMLPILVESISFDIERAAEECIQAVNSGKLTKDEQTGEISAKPKQPLTDEDQLVQRIQERLTTLQLSLELISNVCIQDSTEDDGWEDADETMGDDEADEIEESTDPDNVDEDVLADIAATGETSNTEDIALLKNNPVLHILIYQVFPQLIKLASTTKISYPPQETPAKYSEQSIEANIINAFSLTHLRAFECMNNFFLAMNDLPSKFWFKEKKEESQQAWNWLFQTAGAVAGSGVTVGNEEPQQELRGSVLEAIVGCLWALGRGLGQDIVLQEFHVPALLGSYNSSARDSMRVKCIGTLGVIAMRQGDVETNKTIGNFFIKALQELPPNGATTTDAATEMLNAIFDVYGDYVYDYDLPVFVNGGYLSALKQVVPQFRNAAKHTDKRKNRDLRLRADEALGNLNAFIRYKQTERK